MVWLDIELTSYLMVKLGIHPNELQITRAALLKPECFAQTFFQVIPLKHDHFFFKMFSLMNNE